MTVTLTCDITSPFGKRRFYAKAKEVVEVIAGHSDVLIVKGNETFSVHKSKTIEYASENLQSNEPGRCDSDNEDVQSIDTGTEKYSMVDTLVEKDIPDRKETQLSFF